MAELILTEEEKAAALWSDLDDASLGRLVKKKMAFLESASDQMDRTIIYSAALLLACSTVEMRAESMVLDLDGVTESGKEFGDWVVTVTKKATA